MKKKSRLEVLRGKLQRIGEHGPIHDAMPENIAESFIAEMRFCPDCAAAAAKNWRPGMRGSLLASNDAGTGFRIGKDKVN